MTTIVNVPVAQIVPGDNDRKTFSQAALADLAQSISEHGLAQPVTVRPVWECSCCGRRDSDFGEWCDDCHNDNFYSQYEIVAGERRFRAVAQLLQWDTIPAIIRTDLDDEAASAIMLAENVHRTDLSPIEEANAYQKRIERFDWSISEVASHANVSEAKVRSRLKLLTLTPEIQHLISIGNLPIGFGELLSILDTNRQHIALVWLRDQHTIPTTRTFSVIVSGLHEQQVQEAMFDLDALLAPQVISLVEGSENGKLSEMLPTIDGLPDLPQKRGGIGAIIDAYIAHLVECHKSHEAQVMMDFWVKAMRANYGSISAYESKALATLSQM